MGNVVTEVKKEVQLFTDGEVEMNGREYTRLIGGFNNNNPVISDLQIANILEYKHGARQVRERVNKNIDHFTFGLDIMNVKSSDVLCDTNRQTLKSLGYTEQAINLSKCVYLFSQSGFLLFLKFAEGDRAIEIYKDFIEEYFKIKAENQVMKKSIKEEIKELEQDRYKISGLAVFNPEQVDRVEAQKRLLNLDNRLARMKSAIDNESIRKALEKQAKLTESKNQKEYVTQSQFGERFNSKIGAKTVGKLFKIVGLAKKANRKTIPYQQFVPEYAVNIINNDNEKEYAIFYKWNYSKCSRFVNQWLLDHDYHDMFYSITEKEELIKFIDALYDKYINHVEVLSLM